MLTFFVHILVLILCGIGPQIACSMAESPNSSESMVTTQEPVTQGDFETGCTAAVHVCSCHASYYFATFLILPLPPSARELTTKLSFYRDNQIISRLLENQAFRPPIA